jgi:hypothetical protein
VPEKFKKYFFSHPHNISHLGRLAYWCLVSSRYVCCGLAKDVAAWAKTCSHCQQSKTHPMPGHSCCTSPSPIGAFLPAPQLGGPLQYSNNCHNMIIFIPLLIAHPNGWKLFLFLLFPRRTVHHHWFFIGVPNTITSDHGQQFTANLWAELCHILNILHCQTIAYHPEVNGAVKRLHRRLKDALCACATTATWPRRSLGFFSDPVRS